MFLVQKHHSHLQLDTEDSRHERHYKKKKVMDLVMTRYEFLICSIIVAKDHHGAKQGADNMNFEDSN